MSGTLLIVDDNERVFKSLAINFRRNGFACLWAPDSATTLECAKRNALSAAILDLSLGSESGLDVMAELVTVQPELPIIFISGFGTLEAAVAAMKMGAYDFLPKPLDFKRLLQVVRNAIAAAGSESADIPAPTPETAPREQSSDMIASSPAMRDLLDRAARAADSNIAILVTGESGTGKELFAEFIHAHSRRHDRPLVRVNCSAIADSLAESELFGHAKGAFTGAADRHPGYFEQADGGTLHLDEIGDMPLPIQAKILRTLENSMIRPVGGTAETRVDIRLVASTNKNLAEMAEQGLFRTDLFYRINALQFRIPPLRERPDDIKPLLTHFLADVSGSEGEKRFSVEAEKRLLDHSWPGNVRELKNLVKVAALLAPGGIIEVDDLPQAVREPGSAKTSASQTRAMSGRLEDAEKNAIRAVLDEVGGNRRMAAERLGISIRSLYYKLERYDLS